jgi:metal-sulfur cluster biosynthetic enzyme
VSEVDGVANVRSRMTFSPPWTPDLMSEEAKFALGY